MCDLCRQIFGLIIDPFRSRAALEAEVLVLKQQIIVLRRGKPGRLSFLTVDKIILGWAYRLLPSAHVALAIVKPDTVIRWHRAGFRLFWRWKSRRGLGRPAVPAEIRQLIREMSVANPLWGAPRIHGELLRLGIDMGKPALPSIWCAGETRHRRAGRRSCAIMPMALPRWICSWSRPSHSASFMAWTQGTLMRSRGDRDRSRVSDGKCLHNQVRDRIGL
jgi:hypothetical protein